jgi:integration host factor subunit beta
MNTKTRVDLAKSLAPKFSLTEQQSERFIVEFLDEVRTILNQGDKIELRGFGTFYPVYKPKRLARDPNTGERFPKPAYSTMRFRPSKKWKKEET